MNGTDAAHDARIDVDYTEKTAEELEELRAHFMSLHEDAHDAYRANGRQDGSVWDEKMKDLMAEVRAIDDALYAIDQDDEGAVDRGRGVATDGGEDVRGETLKDVYGEIDPAEVEERRDWDPALAPEDFGPETAPNGRRYFTAAWDGGVADITDAATNVYELEKGDPAVMIYVSNRGGAQVFEGELERADGNQIVVRDGDDVRTAYAADMDGRTDAVKGTTGRHVGTMLELRATRDRGVEESLEDAVDDEDDDGEDPELVTDGGEDVETFTFDGDADDDAQDADVFVSEQFVDSWGTERVVLDGDTYDAKEAIKSTEWENTHYKFDDGRKAWLIDADAVDELDEALASAGFTFDADAADDAQDAADEGDTFDELLETADEGDRISVTYWMKNREDADREDPEEWQKTREGVVTDAIPVNEMARSNPYETESRLYFEDDENGRTRTLKRDDRGRPGIYGGGYHPFMGSLATVELVTAAADGDDEDDGEEDADQGDADGEELDEERAAEIERADDATPGDEVIVHREDGEDVRGSVTNVKGTDHTAELAEHFEIDIGPGVTLTFERADGHRMILSVFGDAINLYTKRGGSSDNGDRAIVEEGVSFTLETADDEDGRETLLADGGSEEDPADADDAVDVLAARERSEDGDAFRVEFESSYRGRPGSFEGVRVTDPYQHRDTPDGALDLKVTNEDGNGTWYARIESDGTVKGLDHATRRHDFRKGSAVSLERITDEDREPFDEVLADVLEAGAEMIEEDGDPYDSQFGVMSEIPRPARQPDGLTDAIDEAIVDSVRYADHEDALAARDRLEATVAGLRADDEDEDDVDRGRGVETDGGQDVETDEVLDLPDTGVVDALHEAITDVELDDVERAADVSPAVQYPVLEVKRVRDRSADAERFKVRCTGVDLTELTDGCLTAYKEFEVESVISAGSAGPGVYANLRYTPDDVDTGRGVATDGGRVIDDVPEDHQPDESAEPPFETDRRLRVKKVLGTRFKFSHPTDAGKWIEGPTMGVKR